MEIRICVAEAAPVRAEPDEGAEQVTQALTGEPLAVEEKERQEAMSHMPRFVMQGAMQGGMHDHDQDDKDKDADKDKDGNKDKDKGR